MGSREGVLKTAAARVGLPYGEYLARLTSGERWCTGCKEWHPNGQFSVDRSRGFRLGAQCLLSKRRPRSARNKDHEAARYAVNLAVRYGRLPRANAVPCTDCSHVWAEGERRHEYDHYAGYAPEQRLTVQSVCTLCHADREKRRRNG